MNEFLVEMASRGENVPADTEQAIKADSVGFRGDSPYLVINTEFASRRDAKHFSARDLERLKWARLTKVRELLKSSSRSKMGKKRNKLTKKFELVTVYQDEHKTTKCMWVPLSYAVEHWKAGSDRAYFRSIVTCGVRSTCPVCGDKIAAYDRERLQAGLQMIAKKGWGVEFITYTQRHDRYVPCDVSLDRLLKTMRSVKSGRKWQNIKSKYGIEGSFSKLENTFSFENGHHWHKHVGEVVHEKLTDGELQQMRDEISELYLHHLEKIGGSGDFEIAVHARHGDDYAAEYAAKFGHEPQAHKRGLSHEMASHSTKTKGLDGGHYGMFQLVDLYAEGDQEAGAAFLDYVQAASGKALLFWSAGLAEKLEMSPEISDEEKVARVSDDENIFALYPKEMWRKVRARSFDVLDASKGMEFDAFKEYMQSKGMDAESPVFELVTGEYNYDFGRKAEP